MSQPIVFIAGVADDKGFGFAIAQSLADQYINVVVGVWPPMLSIFQKSIASGKYDHLMRRSDGTKWTFTDIVPLDVSYDSSSDIPESVATSKRYAPYNNYSIAECATYLKTKYQIAHVVHAIGNAPEIRNDLLNTSRQGYLSALSQSSYSFVSLAKHFAPLLGNDACMVNLTFRASTSVYPGYGGGMSSAKAALESDTKVLAYELGRKFGIRVNTVSAGPLGSRAAKAIGFIDEMITYYKNNAPLAKELKGSEVAETVSFLLSNKASAITGSTLFVDNGLHIMGYAVDAVQNTTK